MKKLLGTLLFVFGAYSSVAAQSKGDVELGVNLGYSFFTASNSQGASDSGSSFNFGGSMDYYFSNRWSIKSKLIYDTKGWDNGFIYDYNTGYNYITDFRLKYLTVPVMANWHFGKTRNWYLNFGPYVGFLMSAEDSRFKTDLKSAFNSTDFGLALGIGVKIPVSDKAKISIEYDDQSGLSDVFKQSTTSAVRNSRGSFNVGVNFLLK